VIRATIVSRASPRASTLFHVSTIGYRLLKKEVSLEEGVSQEILFLLGQEAATIRETVHVTTPVFEEVEKSAPSQIALTGTEIRNLAGVLIDDPIRSVQTLPGVGRASHIRDIWKSAARISI